MGIGYIDSIILYNRIADSASEEETYYGTRFDNVRIELTQGNRIASEGNESADVCVVKIPMEIAEGYLPPMKWKELPEEERLKHFTLDKENKNFFVIAEKKLLKTSVDLPVGRVDSNAYIGGFYQYISEKYGYAYQLGNVDVYEMLPRFEIGGR